MPTLSDQDPAQNGQDQGFVLVWVLGSILALAAILAPFAVFARIQFMTTANIEQSFRFGLLADGFSTLALSNLPNHGLAAYDRLNGHQQMCTIDGYIVAVTLQDHSGLIDLNGAPPELLALGFQTLGFGTGEAAGLAQTALAFRQIASRGSRPASTMVSLKHAPFEAVAELKEFPELKGISTGALLDVFTVYARQGTVSGPVSPPSLQKTLSEQRGTEMSGSETPFLSGTITVRVEIWSRDRKRLGFSEKVVAMDLETGELTDLERRSRRIDPEELIATTILPSCSTLLGVNTLG